MVWMEKGKTKAPKSTQKIIIKSMMKYTQMKIYFLKQE